MDPVTIALICAAMFGTVMVISAFIRQVLLSRDKQLNDAAQERALAYEVTELQRMREQMQNKQRFDAHYQILSENKDAIKSLDMKIEKLLEEKTKLVERYAEATIKESNNIITSGEVCPERKADCDKLRNSIGEKLAICNRTLEDLQRMRAKLWDSHLEFQKLLLGQERARNTNLDALYRQHTALLEKVYIRHIDDEELIAVKNVEASTLSFRDMLTAPLLAPVQFFLIQSNNDKRGFSNNNCRLSLNVGSNNIK